MRVPPGEARPLADALARILDEPVLAGQLARAGRRRVESDFDLHRNVAELAHLFEEAIDAHRLPVD